MDPPAFDDSTQSARSYNISPVKTSRTAIHVPWPENDKTGLKRVVIDHPHGPLLNRSPAIMKELVADRHAISIAPGTALALPSVGPQILYNTIRELGRNTSHYRATPANRSFPTRWNRCVSCAV
jgi:hypothetical protein